MNGHHLAALTDRNDRLFNVEGRLRWSEERKISNQ